MPREANQESPAHIISKIFSGRNQIYFLQDEWSSLCVLLNPWLTLEVAEFTLPHQVPVPQEVVAMAAPPSAAFTAA